jgi:hypothetical protein
MPGRRPSGNIHQPGQFGEHRPGKKNRVGKKVSAHGCRQEQKMTQQNGSGGDLPLQRKEFF